MPTHAILQIQPLGFPWQTIDPFLFCVYHDDAYPRGNAKFGPAAPLAGRNLGQDFAGQDGWRMYHGLTVPGFPSHPHRGFETVTIVRRGLIDHSDSLGAAARFGGGDVQWLTAGRGIVHSEMFPLLNATEPNPLELFQIWLNLPARNKMAAPHFTMLWNEDIPTHSATDAEGRATHVACIAGRLAASDGADPLPPPPDSWAAQPEADLAIWTIQMQPGARWTLPRCGRLRHAPQPLFLQGRERGARRPGRGPARRDRAARRASRRVAQRPADERVPAAARPPHRRAGGAVRPVRDEHAARASTGFRRLPAHRVWRLPWPDNAPVHGAEPRRFARHADGRVETRGLAAQAAASVPEGAA